MGDLGGIAAGHAQTAQAGADILRDGGTAVDAAISALWTACVCEPVLASPGGGGFALVGEPTGRPICLDFFVQTPKIPQGQRDDGLEAIDADFGDTVQTFHIGPGSVATPGFIPGLFTLHARYGRLPMVRLAEHAIALAKTGVVMTDYQARLAQIVAPILTHNAHARALHAPEGQLLQRGERLINPPLADALDALSREGARLAIEGEIAQAMVEASAGGHLTLHDMRSYRVEHRDPLQRQLIGHGGDSVFDVSFDVATNPAPSAGGGLISAILARYQASSHYDPLAFATALDAVDQRWRALGKPLGFDDRLMGNDPLSPAPLSPRGTTHVSVIDRNGMAVAVTVSNGEGNGALVSGCGFMMNNMLGEDDLLTDGPGSWTPDQRLASMMAPTLVADKQGGLLSLGSGGSNRIRSAMAQVLLRWGVHGQRLTDAIAAPRLHVEEGHLDAEPSDEWPRLQRAFEDHRLWDAPSMFFGGVHGVERQVNTHGRFSIDGAGDGRRDGVFLKA